MLARKVGRARARLAGALVLPVVVLASAACAGSASDPSAAYFPKNRLVAASPPPVDVAANLATAPQLAVLGAVSRPNLQLTPGAVATRDVNVLCQQPKRTRTPIAYADQRAGFLAYRIPFPQDASKYGLDYLVPLQLGGAPVIANLWPVANRGIGFHEKEQLNAKLRVAVCRGELPLAQAQQDIVADWYNVWLQYGAG
jgi:hypothetical protein